MSYNKLAQIDVPPLPLRGSREHVVVGIKCVVTGPVGHDVVPLGGFPRSPASRAFRPGSAVEFDDAAEIALCVGDEEGLPVGGEDGAANRSKKVKDLFRLERLRVDDANVIVRFSGDEHTRAGSNRGEA